MDSTVSPSPWRRHHLYRNPFGELSARERATLAIVDVDDCIARLRGPTVAVQFIGDCGRGKTTRLLAIGRQLPEAYYVYLPEHGPTPPIADGNPLLIDEAQRLSTRVRRTIFSTGRPLVLATHRDLTRPLKRYGYQVHSEAIGAGNNANLIYRLVNTRIEASRTHTGPSPTVSLDDARQLFRRFGDDIRSLEHYLYDRLQQQVMSDGEVRFID